MRPPVFAAETGTKTGGSVFSVSRYSTTLPKGAPGGCDSKACSGVRWRRVEIAAPYGEACATMLCLPNRNSGTKRTFHCSLQHRNSGAKRTFHCSLPHRISSYKQTTFPTACSVCSGVGAKRRSGVVFPAGRRKHKRWATTGMQRCPPLIGSLERMGINKGKGLSVPSPYFDLWLLSVESESNKRLNLSA